MIRSLIAAVLLASPVAFANSQVIECIQTHGDSRGWLPSNFTLRLHQDGRTVSVMRGRSQTFGSEDFKKKFGGGFWSTGKGRSDGGDISYSTQLVLKNGNQKYRLTMKVPGFLDNDVGGACRPVETSSTNTRSVNKNGSNSRATKPANLFVQCIQTAEKHMSKLEALDFCEDYSSD